MDLRSVTKHIQADFMSGNAVILKGPPGLGKTQCMAKVFAWFRAQHPGKRVGLATTFMATQSVVGGTGLPWKGVIDYGAGPVVVTDPAIPEWFLAYDPEDGIRKPATMFDHVMLVIEEWGQGAAEVKRLFAEVFLSGACGKWKLPEGSPRIALTNVDARDGITKEFDFIIGRRGEYEITGDVDVWIEDFADKPYRWEGKTYQVMPVTKAWAKQNPMILFEPKPEKQGPWCNPRTLTMWDRYAQTMATFNGGKIPVDDAGFIQGSAGKIGMPAVQSLLSHLQFLIELPHYEDVVADPDNTPVPNKADLQMLMAYELAGRVKTQDLGPVIRFMTKKPGMAQDMAITFVQSLLRRDYHITREPAMQAWIAKNASMLSIINALA